MTRSSDHRFEGDAVAEAFELEQCAAPLRATEAHPARWPVAVDGGSAACRGLRRFSFCSVGCAGREFDKLATDLTTPGDSLTREVNLVVSLSRTPPLITSPSRSHLLPRYDRFSLFV